ncbi:efflux RND transporter periplasmic adaptor subunit [Haliea sp.]
MQEAQAPQANRQAPSGRQWSPRGYLLLTALVLILGAGAWHYWQGPAASGYRLEQRPLVQRVVASAIVSNQSVAQVGSEITGVIATRNVREGDVVQLGDLLLTLRDEEYQARLREVEAALRNAIEVSRPEARAAMTEAQNNLEQASRERIRRERLFANETISKEQLEQAQQLELTARTNRDRARLTAAALAEGGVEETVLVQRVEAARALLAKTRIHSQIAGIVLRRAVEPGDLVQPGRTLLEIARLGSSEILMPLDEKNLAPIALNQPAWVVADAYPERTLEANISFIAPSVDTARGTVDVHLALLAPADFLLPGMTVSVTVETARREQALVIPNDALHQRDGSRAVAFRVRDGTVERVDVRLGLFGTGSSEVLEGLEAGDRVLVDAVPPDTRVRFRAMPMPGGATQ